MTDYAPKTLVAKLGWLVEECGEVQAAVGKTLRHGLFSVNPELPDDEQEENVEWVLRELEDLSQAITTAQAALREARAEEPGRPYYLVGADRFILMRMGSPEADE